MVTAECQEKVPCKLHGGEKIFQRRWEQRRAVDWWLWWMSISRIFVSVERHWYPSNLATPSLFCSPKVNNLSKSSQVSQETDRTKKSAQRLDGHLGTRRDLSLWQNALSRGKERNRRKPAGGEVTLSSPFAESIPRIFGTRLHRGNGFLVHHLSR